MQRAVSWHEEMTSSMILSLKDTFHSVQEDISASFHKIADTKFKSRQSGGKPSTVGTCDLNAGDELLQRYQQNWAQIHEDISHTAKQAQMIDALTLDVFNKCLGQCEHVAALRQEASSIPPLVDSVTAMGRRVGELQGNFDELEAQILDLGELVEALELQELQINHRLQLASYREKKRADALTLADELSSQYAATLQEREQRQQELQREKSQVYGENFRQDLITYKQTVAAASTSDTDSGPRSREASVSSKGDQVQVTLEDVDLECDRTELDEFLDTADSPVEFDGTDSQLHMSVSPVVTPSASGAMPVVTPSASGAMPGAAEPQSLVVPDTLHTHSRQQREEK